MERTVWNSHTLSKRNLYNLSDLYPFIPEPLLNETITSWIVRLADKNYFSFVEFLRNELINENKLIEISTLKKIWAIDLDRDLPEDLLFHFSKKTGFNQLKLDSMMLKSWKNVVYGLFITGHKTTKSGGLRYCPLCLNEDEIPYYRKEWRLKLFTCCPRHKIYLYDRCSNPDCGKPLNLSQMKYKMSLKECVYCGNDLSQSQIIPLSMDDRENEVYLEFIRKFSYSSFLSVGNGVFHSNVENIDFFEALYFLSRFVISYYPFITSKYANDPLISSRLIKNKKTFLKQRNNIFENIPISHLILKISLNLLQNPQELREFIFDNQNEFNYWTQKGNVPFLLEEYRNSKGINPIITPQRIEDAIQRLISNNRSLSYRNVALEASCAENFYRSHPELKNLVDSFREKVDHNPKRIRTKYRVNISKENVINTIQQLRETEKDITYLSIATILGVKQWNLKSHSELVKIIQPYLSNKAPTKKYRYNENDVIKITNKLKKKRIKITINEVCRQLDCHKTYFRNNPKLKEIILSEKEKQQNEIEELLPNFIKEQDLSDEAKNYETVYIKFQKEMELLGKNWRIIKNEVVSKKYGIPEDILVEIKMKYCPNTKKEIRRQKEKKILKTELGEKKVEKDTEKLNEYLIIYREYTNDMQEKGKMFKSAKNTLLAKKLGIPLEILIEIKKKYCKY